MKYFKMDSYISLNQFRHDYSQVDQNIGTQSYPGVRGVTNTITEVLPFQPNILGMALERIKKLEDSVLALQTGSCDISRSNGVDSDVIARLTSLEASVMQEKAMKGELKRKLKFANNQNSRLQLRLRKEKARSALFSHRMKGNRLPVTPEDKAILHALLPDDRISKSMNDIPKATSGNQGRVIPDSSDSQSFTDEDSLPKARSQIYPYISKGEYSRDVELGETTKIGAQRIGVRMNGDQALQLLPSYQQTIIQQQQEIRELGSKINASETKHINLVQATEDGLRLEESLSIISEKDCQIDRLKHKIRELQITLIEFENERNDAVNLAKDLSLQLTRAKLAKDTALRTSRQLMEQIPTRPPRDRTPESSVPSTPSQTEPPVQSISFPTDLSNQRTPNNSRFLPQPPGGKGSRPNTPKIITTNDYNTSPMTSSQSYDHNALPRSVQIFKKSVLEQKPSDTLPSKLVIKNKSKANKNTGTNRSNSSATNNEYITDRLSPLQESPKNNTDTIYRLRSDSSPELCSNSIDVSISETPKGTSKHKHKQVNIDTTGKNAISSLASGLGLKGKSKEKIVKVKKVRTLEEPIAPSAIGKIHKRFSSLNSLPNAFKRSPKQDDKKKTDNTTIPNSDRKHKHRLTGDDLEIEFKHITNPNQPYKTLDTKNGTNKTCENLQLSLSSLPISPADDFGPLVRSKKSQEINSLTSENKPSHTFHPWP